MYDYAGFSYCNMNKQSAFALETGVKRSEKIENAGFCIDNCHLSDIMN